MNDINYYEQLHKDGLLTADGLKRIKEHINGDDY
jgi:hypothetical protein